ncbi:MAG: O-antigen ligase [Verrucomicrobiales bacterium]
MPRGRKRSSQVQPLTPGQKVYDYLLIGLMLIASIGPVFFFGGTVGWVGAPFMLLGFFAASLFFFRAFFSPNYRNWYATPGVLLWLLILGYLLLRYAIHPAVAYTSRLELLHAVSYFVALVVWTEVAFCQRRWKWLLGTLILLVTLTAWYAMIQHAHGSTMVLWQERPEQYELRASSTYICPNHFAHLLVMVVTLCVALVFNPSAGGPLRFISGYAVLIMLPPLYLSLSRSGWLGAAAGISIVLLLLGYKKSKVLFAFSLLGIPAALAAVFGLLWFRMEAFRERIEDAIRGDVRMDIWPDTISMIKSSPWWGNGPGSYTYFISEFREQYLNVDLYVRYAHNEYLHIISEYGILGASLFFIITTYMLVRVFIMYVRAESRRDSGLATAMLAVVGGSMVHAVFDFNFHILANVHVLVFILAVLMSAFFHTGALKAVNAPKVYRWASLVAALSCLWCMWLSVQWYVVSLMERDVTRMVKAASLGETYTDRLERKCRTAIKVDHTFGPAYRFLGDEYRALGFWNIDPAKGQELMARAEGLYHEALQCNPRDQDALLGLGEIYAARGENERAEAGFKELIRLDRTNLNYQLQYGLYLKKEGRLAEALAVFEQAVKMSPSNETATINVRIIGQKLQETR